MATTPPTPTPTPPVLPDEFCAAVPKAGEKLCAQIGKALIQVPLLLCRFFSWMMTPEGKPSDDFKLWVGTTAPAGTLPAPTNLQASDTFNDKVLLTWTSVSLAAFYEVWRGDTADSMIRIFDQVTETTKDDTTGNIGQQYYYAIKASDGTIFSGFSNLATGMRKSGTDPVHSDALILGVGTDVVVTVPALKTRMNVWMWGGGGNGGDSAPLSNVVSPPPYKPLLPGGGGASSGNAVLSNLTVIPGEIWLATTAARGGENAKASSLEKKSDPTQFIKVYNGANGQGGTVQAAGQPGQPAPGENTNGGDSHLPADDVTHTLIFKKGNAGVGFKGGAPQPETIGPQPYSPGEGGDGAQPVFTGGFPVKVEGLPGGNGLIVVTFT